jgi:glycosyltransferase involved in cell wall biosynthesis
VKPEDANGFAEAVMKLYKDTKLSSELGMKGKEHVSEFLTSQKIGERIYEVLASVCCL